jgi:membrane protein YqaA with SNARE-associated domain
MGVIKYLGSLIKNDTGNSSKSFTLVLSAIISFISGLVICFVITYDVITNGFVKTDLEATGIFMLCMGGYMAGGSVSKIFGDRYKNRRTKHWDDEDEYYPSRKKKKEGMYGESSDYGEDFENNED